ncbi:hemerythrin [Actinomadura sp. NBRC 104425]|uniref:nitroreductase/quinone reductase family protein n=1 Tax=Actinomadura sp. NBRC 104425 TaxID=3032204 RepID=UPI0024A00FCE|nr:nitroreductase/quinone reductase family protein [Actinomadura sp. NBRC 104425]GLZ12963.1 hemerythrin [Actinomadura sp. NBRC 104425]
MPGWNDQVIEEFRSNGGRVGGAFAGTPLLLLTTTGARTGRRHTTPLTYLRDGEHLVVFASNAGADRDPAWYGNLLADPKVAVEIGDGTSIEAFDGLARPVEGAERDRLYGQIAERFPAYAEYQAKTERVIPVVALYRSGPRTRALGDELMRIHRELRRQMDDLLGAVDARLTGDRPAGAPPTLDGWLRERCLLFCEAVHGHHTNEDERGFPLLEKNFPELAPVLQELRREHETLARIRAEIEQVLARLDAPGRDAAGLRDRLHALAGRLREHFDKEERRLLDHLNRL